jgi:hypothetical protein
MPASSTRGRRDRGVDVTLHASGAEVATGSSAGVELDDKGTVRLTLDIAAVAGTNPTLDVTIETSSDNGVNDAWRALGTFVQQTAVATGANAVRASFGGCDRYVRARRVIGGTAGPSFTYSITGEAV